jgi:hypothetical protein
MNQIKDEFFVGIGSVRHSFDYVICLSLAPISSQSNS